MPIYVLRCSYAFTDGRDGLAFDRQDIEADSVLEAIDLARIRSTDRKYLRLQSAYLIGPDRQTSWSLSQSGAQPLESSDDGTPFDAE